MNREQSKIAFNKAKTILVGGVNSPVRAFRAVGGNPVFIERGQGPHLFDVDGNRYVDYVGAYGPMILGHAHPAVVEAVAQAASGSFAFGSPTVGETRLAELVREAFPSMEKVRLVNSGTEATMSALRLARGITGRPGVIKAAGCYHGHVDALLVTAGSGATTLGTPDSLGVPASVTAATHVVPFNDLDTVAEVLAAHGDQIAALIIEPVVGNMGVVPPSDGYLEGLRALTREHGVLLILDEVMTGLRVSRGGAQELYGVRPDLTCLGKVIGGGLPIGAYGGSEELMSFVAPEGGVYQAGTLSGNPIAVAAGRATVERLSGELYRHLESAGAKLQAGIESGLRDAGVPGRVQRVGSMWTLFFGDEPVVDYDAAKRCSTARFSAFFNGMLERGVLLPPSQFEACFISAAHDDEAIEATIDAARHVLANDL